MAYNPAKMYELMYGRPAGSPEPPDFAIFKHVSDDFLDISERQGKAIVRQLSMITYKAEFMEYLQYVFFVFAEDQSNWPTMPPDKIDALSLGRLILGYGGGMPNYDNGLKVPPAAIEDNVDKILKDMADWCDNTMRVTLMKDYVMILDKHESAFRRLHPEVPKDMGNIYLRIAFERQLRQTPGMFTRSGVVTRLVNFVKF